MRDVNALEGDLKESVVQKANVDIAPVSTDDVTSDGEFWEGYGKPKPKTSKVTPEDLTREVLDTERMRHEHFYPTVERKPVVVRINVDLYYQIETEALPVWLEGDGIVKAVEVAFEDVGAVKWQTFASTGVMKQPPSEITINKFVFDH